MISHMQTFVPEKLRELRVRAGLSQAQLAHAVSRSRYTIRDYERGGNRQAPYKPSIGTLAAIAEALGCRVEDFFAEERAS
jgi:transcriptional regulator with XRE-family HTH domain